MFTQFLVEPIIFTKDLPNLKLNKLNETVELDCEISRDDVKIQWFKDEVQLTRSDKYEFKSFGKTHKLIVNDVTEKVLLYSISSKIIF